MAELPATFSTPKGHVIIAGCSHSTIETIIPEKMKVRKKKIYLVTVGFHLIPYNRKYTKGLAKRMQQEGIRYPKCGSSPHHRASRVFYFQIGFRDKYKFFGLGETLLY